VSAEGLTPARVGADVDLTVCGFPRTGMWVRVVDHDDRDVAPGEKRARPWRVCAKVLGGDVLLAVDPAVYVAALTRQPVRRGRKVSCRPAARRTDTH
jgi:hypothetical protein